MKDIDLAPTAPCNSSGTSSIAGEVIVEVRAALAVMPTGESRRSLRSQLSAIEGAVQSWQESEPREDERKRVTRAALELFGQIRERFLGDDAGE
jgi:hypothetical protein